MNCITRVTYSNCGEFVYEEFNYLLKFVCMHDKVLILLLDNSYLEIDSNDFVSIEVFQ